MTLISSLEVSVSTLIFHLAGWIAGPNEIKTNQALVDVKVEVKVEAELGNIYQ